MPISTQIEKWFSWATLHERTYYIFKYRHNALHLISRCPEEHAHKKLKTKIKPQTNTKKHTTNKQANKNHKKVSYMLELSNTV